ncbi:Hypothetical protein CINCED_3A012484 [Cinara cedri]|uniref:Uncharacterized protein n=1 Tax=Cinara cedri TaxID=506608 RepID=A0A5E4M3M1_9HEMI|nr:Hypothetical protein CINCED_3A012484 [Cinara cedri]
MIEISHVYFSNIFSGFSESIGYRIVAINFLLLPHKFKFQLEYRMEKEKFPSLIDSETVTWEKWIDSLNGIKEGKKTRANLLEWAGHAWTPNGMVKNIMTSTIQGKRPRGRPRQRWVDAVKSDLEKRALGST